MTFPLQDCSEFGNFVITLIRRDRMVMRFTANCAISAFRAKVMSSNFAHGDMYSIQHYMITFVSDLRQVCDFLRFPPPIKLTTTI